MKQNVLTALVLALMICLCGCQSEPIYEQAFALDTVIEITLYEGSAQQAKDALRTVDEYESLWSAHREGSEIDRINRARGASVEVSEATRELLARAVELSTATDGAFDVTLLPLTTLWNIKAASPRVPAKEEIAHAKGYTGMDKLTLTDHGAALAPGAGLDLGAIAKGAIADKMARTLKEAGARCALLNLGGNIVTIGQPKSGAWSIGVAHPDGGVLGEISVGACAISTSSGSRRYFEVGGVRYHHILNPETGYPANAGLSQVTVVAPDGLTADALSTALFVLGEEGARRALHAFPGVGAVLVRSDGTVAVLGGVQFTPLG